MELRSMRQLLALREHGSVAKAARALAMSQPSLSQAIARMEDQLKIKLVNRSPAGSELTPIGQVIVERAAKVVGEAQHLVHEAELIAGGEVGSVRLGIGLGVKQLFLPQLVTQIAKEHPALRLRVDVLPLDRLLTLLASREADLGICGMPEGTDTRGLIAQPLFKTGGVVVARPDHPLVALAAVSTADFMRFPSAGVKVTELETADVLSLPGGHVDHYLANDYDALIPLALAGAATLLAPTFIVRPYLLTGELVRLNIEVSITVTIVALATRTGMYSPIIAKLTRDAARIGEALQA
jgi:DNA-binding transcriptional LysR family regulator